MCGGGIASYKMCTVFSHSIILQRFVQRSVAYPMSPCHPMECSENIENMGLIINLCASPSHPRPAGLLECTQAKTLLLPENLSGYVTELCTGCTFKI